MTAKIIVNSSSLIVHRLFKSILALVFLLTITSYLLPIARAQTPLPPTVSPTSPLFTDMLVYNIFHSFSCLGVGQSVIGQPCLNYIQGVPYLSSVNTGGGVLGTTTGLIGALYANPPVRTADYLASVGKGLGIVKEANAQVVGSGQAVLSPILSLWQVSRNISYVFMIIIFVVIGLMVMFRTKINPQTVITAQAALPGLVLGLILITFSYFLAGLISDMAFVGTNVVGYYFSIAQRLNDTPQDLVANISSQNILSIFSPLTKIMSIGSIYSALNSVWGSLAAPNSNILPWNFGPQQLLTSLAAMIVAQFVLPFGSLFGGIGQLIGGGLAAGVTIANPVGVISFSLSFIAMAVLIYTMFKLLLRLINNYLTIIFLTITAPFQFLAAALPGRQGLATNWILNMLANVLAFPAVIAVLYFVAFLLGPETVSQNCADPCPFQISQLNQREYNSFTPPAQAATDGKIVGTATFPLFGGLDLDFIRLLLAFGALVALPAIPEIIARTIGTLTQAGQLLGQEIGSGIGGGQRYAGQLGEGSKGFAGQVGRVTNERAYTNRLIPDIRQGAAPGALREVWEPNPLQSRAGLRTRASNFLRGR